VIANLMIGMKGRRSQIQMPRNPMIGMKKNPNKFPIQMRPNRMDGWKMSLK